MILLAEYLKTKGLNKELIATILDVGTEINFSKGATVTKEGVVEQYLYFIQQGGCRFFITRNRDAEEITFQFAFQGEFVNSLLSMKYQSPSQFTIETICPTNLWTCHKKTWQNLLNTYPIIKQLYQDILEDLFTLKLKREIQMLKNSPEEQYLELLEQHKEIFQEVPLKHIATYIGITPQSLSRLRKRILKKK
ncbi:MAG TPA: Crp/Fnr family transcriptional regulator [Salinivirgaceae bacterium]|nr:Crp/Fnr family transcriptional regulator [Salinivirgaceae bacterium]HQA76419.1 Crp/Fnr family transcriptional regulator [Salinivirgaceae bacterium]